MEQKTKINKSKKTKYEQKNIIISGANEGIGYYLVQSLLNQGHHVFVLDIKLNHLEILAKKYTKNQLQYQLCDVRHEPQVEKAINLAIQSLNRIDYMIHNACLCTFAPFSDTKMDTFKDVFDVNYYGAIHMIKNIIPHFEKHNGGRIFITSSGVGIMGFRHISPYSSSKAALESLIKCLNIEYKHKQISLHIIHPPLTKTKSSEGLPIPQEFMASTEKVGKGLSKRIHRKKRIITYSARNRFTVLLMYIMPVTLGKFLSKMTDKVSNKKT